MSKLTIPWASWFGDRQLELSFPEDWTVSMHAMQDGPPMNAGQIEGILASSADWKALGKRLGETQRVAIAVDDLSRPTPAAQILSPLLTQLYQNGINQDQIQILMALGTHGVVARDGLVKKLGRKVVENIETRNHSPFSNLADLGKSSAGFTVKVNRTFVEAGLKIGIGCIMPHSEAGFSGGAKIVLPALSGIETIEQFHGMRPVSDGLATDKTGVVEGNELRIQMEEVARKAGLNYIINVVLNSKRQITGLFAGDLVEVHRRATELARTTYATTIPDQVDVAILNAYPKDTEFLQLVNALHIIPSAGRMFVHDQGTIVLTTAASEGRGFHYLMCPEGITPFFFDSARMIDGRRLLIYSPSTPIPDVRIVFPPEVEFYRQWDPLIQRLRSLYGRHCRVAVFPCASMQVAREEAS